MSQYLDYGGEEGREKKQESRSASMGRERDGASLRRISGGERGECSRSARQGSKGGGRGSLSTILPERKGRRRRRDYSSDGRKGEEKKARHLQSSHSSRKGEEGERRAGRQKKGIFFDTP